MSQALLKLTPTQQRIIKVLLKSPGMSIQDIADRAFVAENTLSGGRYLETLRQAKLIYISDWSYHESNGFSTPLYSAGNNKDVPRPKVGKVNRLSPSIKRLEEVVKRYGPIDYRQAAEKVGLSPSTLKHTRYLDDLVKQGKIYISHWRRGRGACCPLYSYGDLPSEPRPPALDNATRNRIYRMRKRAGTEVTRLGFQFNIQTI